MKAHRDGGAERFPDPAVPQSLAVDRALLGYSDERLRDLELHRMTAAKQDRAHALSLRCPVPGIGQILRLGLLYESPDLQRCPRGQDVAAYGRWGTWATASAGPRDGVSGTKLGHAALTWAGSAAAVLCLRNHPAGQQWRARVAKTPGQGTAVTVLAHTLARAV